MDNGVNEMRKHFADSEYALLLIGFFSGVAITCASFATFIAMFLI